MTLRLCRFSRYPIHRSEGFKNMIIDVKFSHQILRQLQMNLHFFTNFGFKAIALYMVNLWANYICYESTLKTLNFAQVEGNWIFIHVETFLLYFVHICVCNLISTNIQIFIDFKCPIIDDDFNPHSIALITFTASTINKIDACWINSALETHLNCYKNLSNLSKDYWGKIAELWI